LCEDGLQAKVVVAL